MSTVYLILEKSTHEGWNPKVISCYATEDAVVSAVKVLNEALTDSPEKEMYFIKEMKVLGEEQSNEDTEVLRSE